MSAAFDPITVIVSARSFLIGDGLTALLADNPTVKIVGRVRHHAELIELVEALTPAAVIIALRSPAIDTMPTIAAARRLHTLHPQLGIVVISDRGNGFSLELLRAGASGVAYLIDEHLPGIDAVLNALQQIQAGHTVLDPSIVDSLLSRRHGAVLDHLSVREIDVLEQVAHGLSNKAIADALHLSIKAVEKHVSTIFRRLDLADQVYVDRRVTAALTYLNAQTSSSTPS